MVLRIQQVGVVLSAGSPGLVWLFRRCSIAAMFPIWVTISAASSGPIVDCRWICLVPSSFVLLEDIGKSMVFFFSSFVNLVLGWCWYQPCAGSVSSDSWSLGRIWWSF